MFKKVSAFLNNLKLRNKLILIYAVIGIIPMIIIMFVSTSLMSDILRSNEEQNIRNYLNQAVYTVEADLQTYNNLAQYISFDTAISQVILNKYDNSYDLYTAITSVIEPQLEVLSYFGDGIRQATMYVDIYGKKYGDIIKPLADIREESWYRDATRQVEPRWYVDEKNNIAFGVNRMALLKKQGVVGIFYVEVEYEKLFEVLSNDMGKNYGIFVTDEDNKVIYTTSKFEDKYKEYELDYENFANMSDDAEYVVYSKDLHQATWKISMYKPDASIISDTQSIRMLASIVIFIGVATLVLGMIWVGRFITRRISYLKKGMIAAEEGDFGIRLQDSYHDEIGELIRGYNTLLGKIEALIKEVYESEISQKKYEMKALQNQINPHFLYNSLSLINWKAIENGNVDISEITLALSKFYRTSLNKGRNTLSIEDEISNVKSYIAIQLVMHDNEFDVEYDIEPDILQYETLNLILQPIVENAIEHGIELMGDGERGKIIIKGWRGNEKIYISIADNGAGMDEEKAKTIITQHSKGYGIRNVNERIQLYYGEEYKLSVKSKLGVGTSITVCIPVKEIHKI